MSVAGHYNCHTRLEAIVATISLAPRLAAKSESVTRLPVKRRSADDPTVLPTFTDQAISGRNFQSYRFSKLENTGNY